MSALRVSKRTILLSAVALATVWLAIVPTAARAEESALSKAVAAKRAPASAGTAVSPAVPNGVFAPGPSAGAVANSFVYIGGPQAVLNLRGRLNVGKSHVYVPYYGNVSADPNHPGWSGVAGIAYGFRTWDVSVVNGGFGSTTPSAIPGGDPPKANPALSLSIRF